MCYLKKLLIELCKTKSICAYRFKRLQVKKGLILKPLYISVSKMISFKIF